MGVEEIINRVSNRFNPGLASPDSEFPMSCVRFTHPLLLCLLALCPIGSAMAGNWPDFRGPAGNGRAVSARLPLSWSETENVRWKVELPGQGWSTPVAWDDQLWMTSADDGGKSLFVLCVGSDGTLRHRVKVFTIQPVIRTGICSIPMYSMNAASSPRDSRSAMTSLPPNHKIAPNAAVKMKVISAPWDANIRVAE